MRLLPGKGESRVWGEARLSWEGMRVQVKEEALPKKMRAPQGLING